MKKVLCYFLFGSWLSLSSPAQTMSTIAGTGAAGYSGDGSAATSATLNFPVKVACDASGNIYFADDGNNVVRRIDASTGIITTIAGNGTAGYSGDGGPATAAMLNGPWGVALDPAGNIYVSDVGNNIVRRIDATTGVISTAFGNGTPGYSGDGGQATSASFNGVTGLVIDKHGNFYVTDDNNNVVRRVDGTTGIVTTIAGNGSYGYSGDGGQALSASLAFPVGISVDGNGNIYLADSDNNRIRKIDNSGIINTIAGNGSAGYNGDGIPATSATLYNPWDVVTDPNGNVYISDFYNCKIRRVDANTGLISTYAGSTCGYGGDGGPATSANMNAPIGLCFTPNGDLLFCDAYSNRVRKVSPPPPVSNPNCMNATFIFSNPRMAGSTPVQVNSANAEEWFSFEAYNSNETVNVISSTNVSRVKKVIVYSGTCSSLLKIGSDSISNPTDTSMSVNLSSLVVGQVYYAQVLKDPTFNGPAKYRLGINSVLSCPPYLYPCTPAAPSDPCELVMNGDFTQHTHLPLDWSELADACGWFNPSPVSSGTNQATPDYFFANGSTGGCPSAVDEPCNLVAYAYGHTTPGTANGYGGLIPVSAAIGNGGAVYCEYMGSKLRTTMTQGVTYNISMWVMSADYQSVQCNNLGILLTANTITQNGHQPINNSAAHMTSAVVSTNGVWTQLSFTHVSNGTEKYLYIGDFAAASTTTVSTGCYSPGYVATPTPHCGTTPTPQCSCMVANGNTCNKDGTFPYYIFDDISIQPVQQPLSISGPTPVCQDQLPITLSTSGGFGGSTSYNWSTGQTGSSISVNAGGVYTVTNPLNATMAACTTSASISVVVIPLPPVPAFSNQVCSNAATLVNITNATPGTTYNWSPAQYVSCTGSCASATINAPAGTVITVIATNNGCSSSNSFVVQTSPTISSVYASPSTICQGQSTVLHVSTNGQTVNWSPSNGLMPNANSFNPTATPSSSTTYVVTATNNSNQCTVQASVQIIVNPLPNVSITTNPSPAIICNGSNVVLTANGGNAYSWTPSTGLSCTNCQTTVASPSANQQYVVSTTNNFGCTGSAAITVTVQCNCNKGYVLPANTTVLTAANQLTPPTAAVHSINHNISIGGSFTLSGKVMFFAPGKSMTVLSGNTLTLDHCHLLACSDMWQGIIVQPGASLIIQNDCMIEDAYTAVDCSSWNQSGNSLTVSGCVFNRNQAAINLSGYSFAGNDFPGTIRNAVFTSRKLPSIFGPSSWSSAATPAALKAIVSVPSQLQSPYAIANNASYSFEKLKAPLNNFYGYYGIHLDNIGTANFNGNPPSGIGNSTIVYNEVQIGDPSNNSYLNLFDGTYYGIYATTSNFNCQNNSFELFQDPPPLCFLCPPTPLSQAGNGIYAGNSGLNNQTYCRAQVIYPGYAPNTNPQIVSNGMPSFNNKFYDCIKAASIFSYTETDLAGADIKSTHSTTSTTNKGAYGFYVSTPVYQLNFIRYNKITNVINGVIFQAQVFSNAQATGKVNVDFNWITANFGNSPGSTFLNNAIVEDNIVNCFNPGSVTCSKFGSQFETADNNTIQSVYRGIEQSNWIAAGTTAGLCEANSNYISLVQDPANLTQFGVNANGNRKHSIIDNNIVGVSTTNLAMKGVYCRDNNASEVSCNYASTVGKGFEFEGLNSGYFPANNATWHNNTMVTNGRGFQLTNVGFLGTQGTNSAPMDNFWQGTNWSLGTLDQTFNDNSNLNNAKLIARSGTGYFPTINNSSPPGQGYNSGPYFNTLAQATNSGSVQPCPALPTSPCPSCQRTTAEMVAQDSVDYPILQPQNTFRSQLSLYKAVLIDTAATDSSAILQSFKAANQNSSLGKIVSIETNLAQGNVAVAQSMNNSFTPSNTIEGNYKTFYSAYIHYVNNGLTSADLHQLLTLANSCPATNGDVVYQARVLYNGINQSYQNFEDNCNYPALSGAGSRMGKRTDRVVSTAGTVYVYPNPSNGEMFIRSSAGTDKEWNIEIKDLTGRLLLKQTVSVEQSVAKLNASLPNGVYIISVTGSSPAPSVQKIVINK